MKYCIVVIFIGGIFLVFCGSNLIWCRFRYLSVIVHLQPFIGSDDQEKIQIHFLYNNKTLD